MTFVASHIQKTICWAILITAVTCFMAADTAHAQRAGRGRGTVQGGGRKAPPRPREPQRQEKEQAPAPGSIEGYILRYKVADEEDKKEDAELIGTLKIKPYGKDTSLLVLQVRRQDNLKVTLGDKEFELDELAGALKKRMHVKADWDFLDPTSKRDDKYKQKVLRSLSFKTTEVDGTVEEILDGGRLIVYGVPVNDMQWPDYVPDNKPGEMDKKKVRKKKLKLFTVEDLTKIFTSESEDADLSDFKVGDTVRVTVVYAGSKPGYVLKVRPPGVEEVASSSDDGDKDDGRPSTPGKPGGYRPGGRGAPQG